MANTKISSHVLHNNAVTSAHIANGAIHASSLSNITSAHVAEGSNLYFTNARARSSISVTGGNLAYDSSTGVLQLTDSEIRDALSAGTGVSYSSGQFSIGQAVGTSDTVTFGNITTAGYLRGPSNFTIDPAAYGDDTGTLIIAGNLQVDGTTTTINSTTLTIDDKNLVLASGAADSAAANGAGITVDGAAATLLYASSGDKFVFNKSIDITGNTNISGSLAFTDSSQIQLGTGNDMQIYHNGAQGEIQVGTGDFTIDAANNIVLDADDSGHVRFKDGGSQYASIYKTGSGFTIDGSGDLTFDVGGDIVLDADGDNIFYKAGGASFYSISNVSGNTYLGVEQADKDLFIRGNDSDGGGAFTALTLDMSAAGAATFASNVRSTSFSVGASHAGEALNILDGGHTGQGAANTVSLASFAENVSGNSAGLWVGSMTNENTAVIGARTASGNIGFQTYNGGSWGERMRITSIGNVHLNTGLDARVQLGTSGTGANSVSDNSVYIRGNDDDLILGSAGNGNISFKENASTHMFIKTGGNVGIGINNPLQKLDVRNGNIFVGGYGGGTDYGMIFSPADGSSYWNIYNDTGGELAFCRNITIGSTEMARFDSAGNFGIGTNNPDCALDITRNSGWAEVHLDGASGGDLIFKDNGVNIGEIYAGVGHGMVLKSYASQDMSFLTGGAAAAKMILDTSGRLAINQNPAGNNFTLQVTGLGGASGDARAVYLKGSGGHTSIGGTGPTLVLQNTNSTVNNIVKLSFESAGAGETVSINAINTNHSSHYGDMAFNTRGSGGYSEKMRIMANGNIGIGTDNPLAPLNIKADSGANAIRIAARSGNDHGFISFYANNNTDIWSEISGSAGTLRFYTGSSVQRMRIDSTGKVNIGIITTVDDCLSIGNTSRDTAVTMSSASAGAVTREIIRFNGPLSLGVATGGHHTKIFGGGTSYLEVEDSGRVLAKNTTTAASPVYTFQGDDNTGLYSPASDTVELSTAGVRGLSVQPDSSVLVGATMGSVQATQKSGKIAGFATPNVMEWDLPRSNTSYQHGDSVSGFSSAYGLAYGLNGDAAANKWKLGEGPSGCTEWLWAGISAGSTGGSGGWGTGSISIDNNYSYLFVLWVKRVSSANTGTYYHGTSGVVDTAGNSLGNPYMSIASTGTLPQNVWCVDIQPIHAWHMTSNVAMGNQGLWRTDTGARLQHHSGQFGSGVNIYRAGSSSNQSHGLGHRTYLYYPSANDGTELHWAQPKLYRIDGSQPSAAELISGEMNAAAAGMS